MNIHCQKIINKAADKVWNWFDENVFENQGLGNIDEVCRFSEYVDGLDDEGLAAIAGVSCNLESGLFIKLLRGTITRGVDKWLEA